MHIQMICLLYIVAQLEAVNNYCNRIPACVLNTVLTVIKVLCYKSEGRGFDSRWCHWNFSLT